MKNLLIKVLYLFVMMFAIFSCHNNHRKVACVGDSITYGDGIKDRNKNSYPAQLQRMLGHDWQVENFGVNGATLLEKGDKPYIKQHAYSEAVSFKPDIVIIKLGTNDTKAINWQHKADYKANYKKLIQSFKNLPSKPKVYLCLPVPVFEAHGKIDSGVMINEIIPLLKETATETNSLFIDLYTPLKGKPEMFSDNIHPNTEGAAVIAQTVAESLLIK